MLLVEVTQVPQSALPVADFREYLRLGTGFSGDDLQETLLEQSLQAALAAIEARTGKILIQRDFSWTLSQWRDQMKQALPVAPISAVTALVLIARTGEETLTDPDNYHLVPDSQRPRIESTTFGLPKVPTNGAVRLEFVAGYGPAFADLPADLGQAVLMLAAHFYEHRHETHMTASQMPYSVNALIERYRTLRTLGGK